MPDGPMSTTTIATASATPSTTQLSEPQAGLARIHLTQSPSPPPSTDDDLARLPAAEALRLVSANLERLVRITGDVPPTPPPRTPTDPQMSGLQAEKDIIARYSPARTPPSQRRSPSAQDIAGVQAYSAALTQQMHVAQQQAIDGVRLRDPSGAVPDSPQNDVPDDAPPQNTQHGAITRKFYSKLEPPISITGYLARLHQFCPASAAVYLAASVYIHRLAVEQAAIPVTRRNVHRLVLAGLRVAAKALEDLAYPHTKVARVGGVSESELARLEISFCFLAGFDLMVGEAGLKGHWDTLRRQCLADEQVPLLALEARSSGIPTPPEGTA